MHIVYSGFGKSTNFYKCLLPFSSSYGPKRKLYRDIRGNLDNMICTYYPIGNQESEENILKISKLRSITEVFRDNSDCKEYPYIKKFNRRFSKEIRVEEKMYILNFIRRLKLYKYYIENYVIDKILPEEKIIHKELLKYFNKYGKCIDKLNILEIIPIENIE